MIDQKVKSVRALDRGLLVLAEIQRRRAVSLHELHEALHLPKATLLRMIVTLAGRGLIWQRLADGAYLPSNLHAPPVAHSVALDRIAEVASPIMARLSAEAAWPSVLAVPRLDHVEVIETNSSLTRLDSVVLGPVGIKLSYIHTATGRAYLAACDPRERAAIIARLRPPDVPLGSEALLEAMLTETQARGYSLRDPPIPWPDRSRIMVARDGRRSMAVAVRVNGQAVASLNITWLSARIGTAEVVTRCLARVQAAAVAIAAKLEANPG